jgi:hypothetical protein
LGSNPRFFLVAAVELIVSNYSPEEGSPIRRNRDDLIRPILPLPQRVSEVSRSAQYFERKWVNLLIAQESGSSAKPDGLPTPWGRGLPGQRRGPLPDVHQPESVTMLPSSEGHLKIRASSAGRRREGE